LKKNFFIGKKINVENIQTKENYYKDYISYSGRKYYEYQLRPNFLIAMAVAPDLFSREKA
jgi:glycogen debranching enzyme